MNLFISGWAGFKEALKDVPEGWSFILPFIDFDERGILSFLKDKSGDKLIGWSTGGHIVLKNLSFFSERFNSIVIVAGFKKFTDYVHQKIINRMIEKMKVEPEAVLKDFLINSGCKPFISENFDKHSLIKGLKYLLHSYIENSVSEASSTVFIHGRDDRVLPLKALYDLQNLFKNCRSFTVKGNHWISFREIQKITNLHFFE